MSKQVPSTVKHSSSSGGFIFSQKKADAIEMQNKP